MRPKVRRFVSTSGGAIFRAPDGTEVRLKSITLEEVGEGKAGGTFKEGGGSEGVEEQQRLVGTQPAKDETEPQDGGAGETVKAVWACYVAAMKPRHRELDDQGRRVIREALKVASVEECCEAIQKCAASAFHMGENDRRRRYNKLSQILKGRQGRETTRERIDFFLDLDVSSRGGSGVTSAVGARISQAKRDVLDAHEFPNDEMVVRRGEESEAWLKAQGVLVVHEDGSTPRFVEGV